MQILYNEKREILAFALVGGIEGATVVDDTLADKFTKGFEPRQYVYKNGTIKENVDYSEDVPAKDSVGTIVDGLVKEAIKNEAKIDAQAELINMLTMQIIDIQIGGM